MPEFDTSEYKLNDYEKYVRALSNTKELLLNKNMCEVRFFDDNIVRLKFDRFFAVQCEEYTHTGSDESQDSSRNEPAEATDDDDEDEDEMSDEDEALADLCKRFDIHFRDEREAPLGGVDFGNHNEYSNALSGGFVDYHLGEGLLDFFYFDIHKNISSLSLAFALLSRKGKEILAEKAGKPLPEEEPVKIRNKDEELAYTDHQWELTNQFCRPFFYSSLYTAAFTPAFLEYNPKVLKRYLNYILLLQREFQERIQFCFDPDFYPSVLGHLYPSERYYLYCNAKNRSSTFKRNEVFSMRRNFVEDEPMPYGCNLQLMKSRLSLNIDDQSPEYREFEEKYFNGHLSDFLLRVPSCISIDYECHTLAEMLDLEFSKMLEANVRMRKCKRCGRYFIMKGNYDANYCDRIAEGQTRTCQELAAQENYKAKAKENPALLIYSKYYKRYAARVRVRQIKEPDFKKWKYQAMTKRDECTDGAITPEEYIQWMEGYFPNRKPKST